MSSRCPSLQDLCNGLRCNDPVITQVELPVLGGARLRSLLAALQGNNLVSSIVLDVSSLTSPLQVDPELLLYVERSTQFQNVRFTAKDLFHSWVMGPLVQVISKNPSILEVEFGHRTALVYDDFIKLLQAKSRTLKDITVCILKGVELSEEEASRRDVAIVNAIMSLPALESLTLDHELEIGPLELLFQHLQSHRLLHSLSLTRQAVTDPCAVAPLTAMLEATASLEMLEFEHCLFSRKVMESIVAALHNCSPLQHLAFSHCGFNELADALVLLFQSERAAGSQRLCKFRFCHIINPRQPGAEDSFASLLMAQNCQLGASRSIGSSLHELDLDYRHWDVEELMLSLVSGGSMLSSLSLGWLNEKSWTQLNHHLPKLLTLQKLCITAVDPVCKP
jgi:hypothetical protein